MAVEEEKGVHDVYDQIFGFRSSPSITCFPRDRRSISAICTFLLGRRSSGPNLISFRRCDDMRIRHSVAQQEVCAQTGP